MYAPSIKFKCLSAESGCVVLVLKGDPLRAEMFKSLGVVGGGDIRGKFVPDGDILLFETQF